MRQQSMMMLIEIKCTTEIQTVQSNFAFMQQHAALLMNEIKNDKTKAGTNQSCNAQRDRAIHGKRLNSYSLVMTHTEFEPVKSPHQTCSP